MKYKLRLSGKIIRDIKRIAKRGYDMEKLSSVFDMLCKGESLPPKFRDHQLNGDWEGFRECHIENDWLLIYFIDRNELIMTAVRTGSHADFGW